MQDEELHQLATETLEAARTEVVERLAQQRLPTSLELQHLIVTDNPEGTGWGSVTDAARGSSLRSVQVMLRIRDESVPTSPLGLREQLEPLAALLDAESELGAERPSGIWPKLTGVEGLLRRCVLPLCLHYLQTLEDVGIADQSLAQGLADELVALVKTPSSRYILQLAVDGLRTNEPIGHRGVRLRPLSGIERGAILHREMEGTLDDLLPRTEFVVPARFHHFMPRTLLEVEIDLTDDPLSDRSGLLRRVVLAFFLHGFDFGSSGTVVQFDVPRWLGQGHQHQPFPVGERLGTGEATVDLPELRSVVDLAYRTPEFNAGERTRQEIVLDRCLRGSGSPWPAAGFLDFVIALEGALLGGAKTELAYKFALYGALFLADERPPTETFEALRLIYRVRSDLVHGSPPKPKDRDVATKHAAQLARAVVRRSLQEGWPDSTKLDRRALLTPLPDA